MTTVYHSVKIPWDGKFNVYVHPVPSGNNNSLEHAICYCIMYSYHSKVVKNMRVSSKLVVKDFRIQLADQLTTNVKFDNLVGYRALLLSDTPTGNLLAVLVQAILNTAVYVIDSDTGRTYTVIERKGEDNYIVVYRSRERFDPISITSSDNVHETFFKEGHPFITSLALKIESNK